MLKALTQRLSCIAMPLRRSKHPSKRTVMRGATVTERSLCSAKLAIPGVCQIRCTDYLSKMLGLIGFLQTSESGLADAHRDGFFVKKYLEFRRSFVSEITGNVRKHSNRLFQTHLRTGLAGVLARYDQLGKDGWKSVTGNVGVPCT